MVSWERRGRDMKQFKTWVLPLKTRESNANSCSCVRQECKHSHLCTNKFSSSNFSDLNVENKIVTQDERKKYRFHEQKKKKKEKKKKIHNQSIFFGLGFRFEGKGKIKINKFFRQFWTTWRFFLLIVGCLYGDETSWGDNRRYLSFLLNRYFSFPEQCQIHATRKEYLMNLVLCNIDWTMKNK